MPAHDESTSIEAAAESVDRLHPITRSHVMHRFLAVSVALAATLAFTPASAVAAPGLASADALALGPDGVLFVADSRAGRIVVLQRPSRARAEAKSFNLHTVDRTIAGLMGTTSEHIRVLDLAVDPASQTAYLAVRRGSGAETVGAVFAASADGTVTPIDPKPIAEMVLADQVANDTPLPRGRQMRDFTVTDLDFHDGQLYVAGMSGTAFDAVMRRVPYPFTDKAATSRLQMFHAAHNQNETRAPIRAQAIVKLGAAWHALAAYTFTPLVSFPLDGLKARARVVGKTIAELGYGNTPTDVIAFESTDMKGKKAQWLLVVNKQRAPVMIPLAAVAEAAGGEGLTTSAGMMAKAGLEGIEVPLVGYQRVADQSPQLIAGLRRDPETGALGLLSFRKDLYLRLTDFVAEYDVPGYAPAAGAPETTGFRTMLHTEEGFIH